MLDAVLDAVLGAGKRPVRRPAGPVRAAGRVRVAMVHGPGPADRDGVSDYVARLVAGLRADGLDVVSVPVAAVSRSGGAPGEGLGDGPGEGSAAGWLRGVRRAGARVRQLAPDLVHVQFAPSAYRFSAVPGALLPRVLPARVPLVTTVHEYGWWSVPGWVPDRAWSAPERLRWWDRETGRLVPRSAALVCTNTGHASQVARRSGRCPAVVPIAANVEMAPSPAVPGMRERLGLPAGATVLAFFGFVHPVKGLRYVVEALPSLLARGFDVHLLVVGGWTSQALPAPEAERFRAELQQLCREWGVAGRVSFTGHLPDAEVSAALQVADLGVLPFTEGVTTKSGSLLTLLGHGLPTAVTRPEAPDDDLRDGDQVVVIPRRRSAEAVAHTLGTLLADQALRARLRDGGRAFARRHRWPEVVAAHRALYKEVLDGRRG